MHSVSRFVGSALLALVFGVPSLLAKDEVVKLEACPEPVQKVIREYSAKGKLEEIGLDHKKKTGGPEVYEAKFILTEGGKRIEVSISKEGNVLKVEDKPKKEKAEKSEKDEKTAKPEKEVKPEKVEKAS